MLVFIGKYSQMVTHVPGFQSSFKFLHTFVLAKAQGRNDFQNHLDPVMLAFIGEPQYVLSNGYPCSRVSVIFHVFLHN